MLLFVFDYRITKAVCISVYSLSEEKQFYTAWYLCGYLLRQAEVKITLSSPPPGKRLCIAAESSVTVAFYTSGSSRLP